MMKLLVVIVALVCGADAFSVQRPACARHGQRSIAMSSNKFADAQKSIVRALAAGIITAGTFMNDGIAIADSSAIEKVPLYTKKSNEVQAYSDINRGFRMLRFVTPSDII